MGLGIPIEQFWPDRPGRRRHVQGECLKPSRLMLCSGYQRPANSRDAPFTTWGSNVPDAEKMQAELEIDGIIGKHVRILRGSKKMSLADLGEWLGLTWQQVQKMEKGVNHISCGRLVAISRAFGVDVRDFFTALIDANDNTPNYAPKHPRMINAVNADLSLDAYRLANAFDLVECPATRQRIIELTITLGEKKDDHSIITKRGSKTKRAKADA